MEREGVRNKEIGRGGEACQATDAQVLSILLFVRLFGHSFRANLTCCSVACSISVPRGEEEGVGFISVSTSSWSLSVCSMLASDSKDSDALEGDCLMP